MNFRLYSDLGLAYPPRQDFGLASANGTSRNLQNLCQHLLYSLYSWLCEFWNEVFYDYIVIFRDVAFIGSSQAVLMFGRRNTTLDSTSADVAALEVEMREACFDLLLCPTFDSNSHSLDIRRIHSPHIQWFRQEKLSSCNQSRQRRIRSILVVIFC